MYPDGNLCGKSFHFPDRMHIYVPVPGVCQESGHCTIILWQGHDLFFLLRRWHKSFSTNLFEWTLDFTFTLERDIDTSTYKSIFTITPIWHIFDKSLNVTFLVLLSSICQSVPYWHTLIKINSGHVRVFKSLLEGTYELYLSHNLKSLVLLGVLVFFCAQYIISLSLQ